MSSKTSHKSFNFSESENFQNLKTLLENAKRVLISTHLLPDGDGLGAEVAFYHYLKRARKTCKIYNPDPLPKRYRFLDPKGSFLLGPGEVELWDTWDLWIIVDTNDPRRLGKLWSELCFRAKKIVFLDHHMDLDTQDETPYPPHASVLSDPQSSSIGEMLYRLFNELNLAKVNYDIALGLYVSVMTDTNSFRYSRTTPLAHQIAGEMIQLGINPEEVYQSIYSSKEISHLKLLGSMLQNIQSSASGKIVWFEMNRELRLRHHASADETQSFLNLLLLIREAEVICFFREEDDGKVRVSLKSKGRVQVSPVASDFGGGGHEYAAGMASPLKMESLVPQVIQRIEKQIQIQNRDKL